MTYKEMDLICLKNDIEQSHNFIIWFKLRFPYQNLYYFTEWVKRYKKGTEYFLSKMDNESLNLFKEVFIHEV